MEKLAVNAAAKLSVRPSFFLWMTVTMASLIFIGFALSYFIPMASGSLGAVPPVTHAHGVVYFAWMILLVCQATLIHGRRVALHRSLGLLGIALASALVIFGTLVTLLFARAELADPTIYGLTYISLVAVIVFALLFALAIGNLHDPAAHKRYVLLATVPLLIAAFNRIYGTLFDLGFETTLSYLPKYLTIDLFVLAMVLHDWRSQGSLHPATSIGSVVNLVPQILHGPIVGSMPFVAFTHWLASIAYFR